MATEQQEVFRAKLLELGLPAHDVKVFGVIRTNVHVLCRGRETAKQWANALAKVFPGAQVKSVSTVWRAKHNQGTSLRPTQIRGFLVAVAA